MQFSHANGNLLSYLQTGGQVGHLCLERERDARTETIHNDHRFSTSCCRDFNTLEFMSGKSVSDCILAMSILVVHQCEFLQGMLAAHIDLKKVTDSLNTKTL